MSDPESQETGKTTGKSRKAAATPDIPAEAAEKPKRITRAPRKKTTDDAVAEAAPAVKNTPVRKKASEKEVMAVEEKPKRVSRKKAASDDAEPAAKEAAVKKTTRKKAVEAPAPATGETPAPPKKKTVKKASKNDPPAQEEPASATQAPGVAEVERQSKSGVKRTSVKRISSPPGNRRDESAETPGGVVERVSSLTDNTPVEVLPTKAALAGQNENQNRLGDKNNRHQNKNNRFQNNRNNRQNNNNRNGNNRFNKNNNRNNNRRENHQESNLVETGELFETSGMLEFAPKGYGFLRTQDNDFDQTIGGVYVSPEIIKKNALRHCQWIHGKAINTNRGVQLREIISVNSLAPEESKALPHFEDLKAINPNKRFSLETTPDRFTTRVVDMMAPIGRGQRGLIVAPPRTGKTVLLQHMAEAIVEKYSEEVHLMILLIDERPEEVTEFKRGIKGAEVFASSNDGRVREHCRLAELCIERAKRLVESGKHVFILMDSITRLARAYNNASAGNGRTMSGGIDARALEMPRRLFAAARNTREAGSLTIIATALIETNSRMDDLIFQEFKGTGNMELVLNRRIAEQYIYPAVDILKSGTRREELILPELVLDKVNLIRRALAGHRPVEAMERLLFFLKKYSNNTQMLIDLKQRA